MHLNKNWIKNNNEKKVFPVFRPTQILRCNPKMFHYAPTPQKTHKQNNNNNNNKNKQQQTKFNKK